MKELKSCGGEISTLVECIDMFDAMMQKAIEEKDYKTLSLTQGEFDCRCVWKYEDGVVTFQDHANDVEILINFEANWDSEVIPFYDFVEGN